MLEGLITTCVIALIPVVCGWFLVIQKRKLEKMAKRLLVYKRMGEFNHHLLEARINDVLDILENTTKRLSQVDGALKKNYIKTKIAEKYSERAHQLAIDAMTKATGLEKSTHKVQWIPVDQMIQKNQQAQKKWEKLTNPGDEENDWMLPFEDEDDGLNFMPNRGLSK